MGSEISYEPGVLYSDLKSKDGQLSAADKVLGAGIVERKTGHVISGEMKSCCNSHVDDTADTRIHTSDICPITDVADDDQKSYEADNRLLTPVNHCKPDIVCAGVKHTRTSMDTLQRDASAPLQDDNCPSSVKSSEKRKTFPVKNDLTLANFLPRGHSQSHGHEMKGDNSVQTRTAELEEDNSTKSMQPTVTEEICEPELKRDNSATSVTSSKEDNTISGVDNSCKSIITLDSLADSGYQELAGSRRDDPIHAADSNINLHIPHDPVRQCKCSYSPNRTDCVCSIPPNSRDFKPLPIDGCPADGSKELHDDFPTSTPNSLAEHRRKTFRDTKLEDTTPSPNLSIKGLSRASSSISDCSFDDDSVCEVSVHICLHNLSIRVN